MNQLSIEAKIKLRGYIVKKQYEQGHLRDKRRERINERVGKAERLSYLLDTVYQRTDGKGIEMTVAELASFVGWTRKRVERALAEKPLPEAPGKYPAKKQWTKNHKENISLVFSIGFSDHCFHADRPTQVYRVPSAKEADELLGITNPTYLDVRLDTFSNYKADISQWLIVKQPGKHTKKELAAATSLHPDTVRKHAKLAGTRVNHNITTFKMSEWNKEMLPETELDYRAHYTFQGAWLQWGTLELSFCRESYQSLRLLGGTDEEILVCCYKMSDYFARQDLKFVSEIDQEAIRKQANISKAIAAGKLPKEVHKELYPSMYVKDDQKNAFSGDEWGIKWEPEFDMAEFAER